MADFDFLDNAPSTDNGSGTPDAAASAESPATSIDNHPSPDAQDCEHANEVFVVRLRCDLQAHEVVSLIRYITDFGSGDARGVALDGGWSMHLTKLPDLRLLTSQFPDLIENHSISQSLGA